MFGLESFPTDFLVGGLLYLAFVVVLFLIFREIVMWYWKINRIVSLLDSIDKKLDALKILERRKPPEA